MDEDAIVSEHPAYLSKPIDDLSAMEYHNLLNTIDQSIKRVRIKEKYHEVEMTLNMDKSSNNFDEGKSEDMKVACDGSLSNTQGYFDDDEMMSSIRLKSSSIPVGKYALLCLHPDGAFSLAPFKNFLSMQSSIEYIDEGETRKGDEKKAEEESTALTVRMQRSESGRGHRRKSHAHHLRKMKEEPWQDVHYTGYDAEDTERLSDEIFSREDESVVFGLNASHYMGLINTTKAAHSHNTATALNLKDPRIDWADVALNTVQSFPLSQQIEIYLRKVSVTRHDDLVKNLRNDEGATDSEIIHKVQASADLVQGVWALKSCIFYNISEDEPLRPFSTASTNTPRGSNIKELIHIYESVLHKLAKFGSFRLEEILVPEGVHHEDVLEMISKLSILKNGRWHFIEKTDHQFIANNKAVVEKYNMKWKLYDQSMPCVAPK